MRYAYMPDTHFGSYDEPQPSPDAVADAFARLIDEAAMAERVGFDAVFLPERHGRTETYAPSPLGLATAIAARTSTIKIASTVLLPALYNPMHLAEQIAMIDNLSRGRFIFGAAVGFNEGYHRFFGIPWERRGKRFEEAMEVIARAFTGERFSFHGEFFDYDDVRLSPMPYQRPRPPIWIGAFSERALERAFDYDGWVLFAIPEWEETAAPMIQGLRERAAERGRDGWEVVLNQDGWIGDDPEAVRARHAKAWLRENAYYATHDEIAMDLVPSGDLSIPAGQEESLRDFEGRQMHFGTPESWRERIETIEQTLAPDWLNIRTRTPAPETGPPTPSAEESLECIRRFGEEVITPLKQAAVA